MLYAEGPNAVDLGDPIGFTVYIGMAFVLYAIRETNFLPNRFLPLTAIVLGILYASAIEFRELSAASIEAGLRLGMLGVGSVASVKYFLSEEKRQENNSAQKPE